MLNKTTIALSVALSIGAASTALAFDEYDGTGAPINMHLVDARWNAPADAYAAVRAPANGLRVGPGASYFAGAGSDPDPFIRFQLWRESQWRTGG
jgi:hypothetical protein